VAIRALGAVTALLIGIVVGIGVVGAVLGIRKYREQPPPPPPVVHLAFAAPAGSELGAGDEPLDAAISPDQRQVVFVATSNGVARLWRRTLDSATAVVIPRTEGARLPAWKPTGTVVAFFVGSRLKQVSLADGAVRDLVDAPGALGATWLPDGSLLFATSNRAIHQLRNNAVSDATTLQAGDRGHVYPLAAGASGDFVYTAIRDDGRRVHRLHAGGQDRDLTETTANGQLVGDRLLFVRQGAVLAQRFDATTGTLAGRSALVATDVGSAGGRAFFAASPRVLLTASAASRARQLVWYDGDRRAGSVGEPGDYWQVRLSPDDRFAAVTYLDPLLRTLDVMLLALTDAAPREVLTTSLAADTDPVWSPDGTRVLFRSLQDAVPNVYARRAHARDAPDEPVLKSELDETPSDWRDSTLLFSAPMKATGLDVWQYDLEARELTGIATSSFNESDARFSPDGEWVSYVADDSGRPDIYAVPYPDGDRVRVSFGGGTRPRWTSDGRALLFMRDEQIMRSEVSGRKPVVFTPAVPLFDAKGVRDFDAAHHSSRIIVLAPVESHAEPTVGATIDWQSIVDR
jgi:Tol biopolymer transport system component